MSRFLPPVNRAMTTLDRSFFQKTFPITAAYVFDQRNIRRVQKECREDLLGDIQMMKFVTREEDVTGVKRILIKLKPEVKHDDLSTASANMREFVHNRFLKLVPYDLHMKYENWSYPEIIEAILPENLLNGFPRAFTRVGHIAHLNLRSEYLPYKHLLASVILDKAPTILSVVNKVQDVGSWSNYGTFPMELLAGSPNTNVIEHESGCVFHFDFAKVYWNSRLEGERTRLLFLFKPGEAVADVMAGVGPVAVPAAKKKVIVWANDLNPTCYLSLKENAQQNKVQKVLLPFNLDASVFIRESIRALYTLSRSSSPLKNTIHCYVPKHAPGVVAKLRQVGKSEEEIYPAPATIRVPPAFSHFIMNLASSATSHLSAFVGAYNGLENIFFYGDGSVRRKMPLIHCYTFSKSPNAEIAGVEICAEISKGLGYNMEVEDLENLENAKRVAPSKIYWCASFRLPVEVAFADPPPLKKANDDAEMDRWSEWIIDDFSDERD